MNQQSIIKSIQDWATHDPEVRSVFLLGSQARRDSNGLSDVDIVIETTTKPLAVSRQLQRLLPVVYHQPWADGKLVLWVGPTQVKVDCWVVADATNLECHFPLLNLSTIICDPDPYNVSLMDVLLT